MSSTAEKPDPDAQPTSKTKVFKLIYDFLKAVVNPKQSTDINKQKPSLYTANEKIMKNLQPTTSDNDQITLTDEETKLKIRYEQLLKKQKLDNV